MEKFKYLPKAKIAEIPKTAGVYAFKDTKNFLYIGKAANLRDRAKNHFQQPTYRDDLFIGQVTRIGYIETDSEIEALLLESQLIKQYEPKYNVMWKDGKGYFFVGITADELPRIFLTHQPETEAKNSQFSISNFQSNPKQKNSKHKTVSIGPFTDGKAIKRTLRSLRRVFPYYTAKKHGARSCQYCNLDLCPGSAPDTEKYKKDIKNLTAILQGKKPTVLKKLQKEMRQASEAQQYEKAKDLRDQIQDLEIIFAHARISRPEEEKMPIQWEQTEKYLQNIFSTKKKISRAEAYDISNIQGAESTGSMPVFIDGQPAKQHYKKFKVRISGKPNDFAMLQEVLTRRLNHKEWGYPDLIIIDGGKGQLSSALKALSKAKIQNTRYKIHVAAIAKKNNELFLPGKSEPLLLKDMPSRVSNFILHIRDEAHRFAINYHRKLRKVDLLGKKS